MKRLVCIVVSLVLIMGLIPCAVAQTAPVVRFVTAEYEGQQLLVTYRITDGVSDQEITALVYARLPDGKLGELLQAHQEESAPQGVYTLSLTVPFAKDGYVVSLGGSGVASVRQVAFQTAFVTQSFGFTSGQTVQQVIHSLAGLSQPAISRGETALPMDETLQPGDVITGQVNQQAVTAFAVIYGDVDLDGVVNAVDALQVLRHAVGKIKLENASLAAADYRQDGVINATNALGILQLAVGKVVAL